MAKREFDSSVGRWIGAGAVVLLIVVGASSWASNFGEYADKDGCESILTDDGRRACREVQDAKNKACNVKTECDVDKQERTIEKYKDAKQRLDDGSVNDADKEKLKEKVEALKEDLDDRKEKARDGIDIAKACVAARGAVQDWFKDTAIPLTEKLRDEALRKRDELLEKLKDAQDKVRDAKEKRDANPDDSSLRDAWEEAQKELREVEQQLEDFNKEYGKDIEYNANRLIKQYEDERSRHDDPSEQAKNRLDKCEKLVDLDY